MNLTLKGFLRGYCRELTGLDTDNLGKLLATTLSDAPSAAEAVMAFAGAQGKHAHLARLATGTRLAAEYSMAAEGIDASGLEGFLSGEDAPERYRKVWGAWLAKRYAAQADRRVIALMRERTMHSMEERGLTAYRLAKDLGLNLGNVYAYLSGGDVTKVSRSTARLMMERAAMA